MCHPRKTVFVGASLALAAVFCLAGGSAHAVPVLQLYLEGATYDATTETWVLGQGSPGDTAHLWVLGDVGFREPTKEDPGGLVPILDVHLAVLYDHTSGITVTLSPDILLGGTTRFGFQDNSTALLSFGGVQTGVPVMNDGGSLPKHDMYSATSQWDLFNLGDFNQLDSQMADFTTSAGFPGTFQGNNMGQISVYDVNVTGGAEDFAVHFDAYNHLASFTQSRFAPFSHDAEIQYEAPPPIPEPISMVMLGCLGAGMLAARRLRGKRAT